MLSQFSASVRRGAIWTYLGEGSLTIGNFVLGVVLARILGPSDFGVFIAVTAFTSVLLMLAQFGVPQALLQARHFSGGEENGAFWLIAVIGLFVLGLIAVIAEPLGLIYDSDSFALVMYGMCGVFIITPYTSVGLALLRREMRFDDVAKLNVHAMAVSAPMSVVAAALGLGVYSLVLGAVLNMAMMAFGVWRLSRWLPGLPAFSAVRGLMSYSGFTTLNNLMLSALSRVDNAIVGLLLSMAALGLYNRSYSLARLPAEQLADSLSPLLLGTLSRIQDDTERSRKLFLKAICAISLVTLPFLVFLMVAGPDAIVLIYGNEWSGAGDPLRVMSVGAVFLMWSAMLKSFVNAQALVRQLAAVNFFALVFTGVSVLLSAGWGLIAVAVAITSREVLLFFMMIGILKRSRIRLTAAAVGYSALPGLGAAAAAAGVGYFVELRLEGVGIDSPALLVFAVGAAVFGVHLAMTLILMGAWRSHAPLAAASALLRDTVAGLWVRMKARGDGGE
jgi:O-antigen/teichoic acid export membrane protein